MEDIYGLTDFFGSTQKNGLKRLIIFDVFLRAICIETGGSALKKRCCLIRKTLTTALSEMQ